MDIPWRDLNDEEKRFIVEGDGKDYDGIRGFFRWLERKKYKVHVRVFLSRYRGYLTCPDCGGARLRREARDVQRRRPHDRSGVVRHRARGAAVPRARCSSPKRKPAIGDKVLKEIQKRLKFLSDVGLDYLTLDRLSSTLSGGESQRINLATSLGSSLVDTLYVLDEPSIGLHSRDNLRLINILRQLRDQGNTVLVVEHDEDMIRVGDTIIDLGLGAGEQGGRVVFAGTLENLLQDQRSLTAKYLRGDLAIPVPVDAPARQRAEAAAARRDRAQPEERRRRDSAQHADLHHRRQRIGQVDARARRAVCGGEAREGRIGEARRRVPQARRRRVRQRRRARRPDADRAHAAVESRDVSEGVRSDPRDFRRDEGREVARAHGEPFLVQRARRPLRGVPGRRRSARRDAVSRRRVRAVRSVRRPPLQAAGARSEVPRRRTSTRCSTSPCARR